MNFLYPFFIAFFLIFLSELGDKTQLLVLSFSSKLKGHCILLGVMLGSFFSHGIAILFGSAIGNLHHPIVHSILQFITYLSFIFFGILTFLPKEHSSHVSSNNGFFHSISKLPLGYIFIIAISIAIRRIG